MCDLYHPRGIPKPGVKQKYIMVYTLMYDTQYQIILVLIIILMFVMPMLCVTTKNVNWSHFIGTIYGGSPCLLVIYILYMWIDLWLSYTQL